MLVGDRIESITELGCRSGVALTYTDIKATRDERTDGASSSSLHNALSKPVDAFTEYYR